MRPLVPKIKDTRTPETEAGWKALYDLRLLQEKHRRRDEENKKSKKDK